MLKVWLKHAPAQAFHSIERRCCYCSLLASFTNLVTGIVELFWTCDKLPDKVYHSRKCPPAPSLFEATSPRVQDTRRSVQNCLALARLKSLARGLRLDAPCLHQTFGNFSCQTRMRQVPSGQNLAPSFPPATDRGQAGQTLSKQKLR